MYYFIVYITTYYYRFYEFKIGICIEIHRFLNNFRENIDGISLSILFDTFQIDRYEETFH